MNWEELTAEEQEEAYKFAVIFQRLPPTKKAILGLLATGKENAEIAEILIMGDGTLRAHIYQIYQRFEIPEGYNPRVYCAVFYTKLYTFEMVRLIKKGEYKPELSRGHARRFEDVKRYRQTVVLDEPVPEKVPV